MAEDQNGLSEVLQKSANAVGTVRGAVKTGKAIAAAAKGGAAGGWIGAAAAFAWENRHLLAKIIIGIVAIMMIPIMIICMLPSIIFGGLQDAFSPNNPDIPVINDSAYISQNITDITSSIEAVLSSSLSDTLNQIENNMPADRSKTEIVNLYESGVSFDANSFIGQYCASKNADYTSASKADMESVLNANKDQLYSYTKTEEERTVENKTTTVNTQTGEETETVTEKTEIWTVYTVVYNGEDYFADNVFHLTDEQKSLANDYAQNLTLYLGGGSDES